MSHERFKAEILPIRDHLFHTARQILSDEDDAEDAVQEVLLRLWNLRDTLGKYDSLPAFATTVIKNHCLDKLRLKKRTDPIDDTIQNRAATGNPYLSVEQKNTIEALQRIIDTLPPLQQAIIKMKDVEEYEVEEIAEITGTNVEAVRVNLSRARKKVREEYIKWTTV